jgi:hypothetical protein
MAVKRRRVLVEANVSIGDTTYEYGFEGEVDITPEMQDAIDAGYVIPYSSAEDRAAAAKDR